MSKEPDRLPDPYEVEAGRIGIENQQTSDLPKEYCDRTKRCREKREK